jgi:hypothetical protein
MLIFRSFICPPCEQAIVKSAQVACWASSPGALYDSRGLVYALLGRYPEAAHSFQIYIDQLKHEIDPDRINIRSQRIAWVASLSQVLYPFTPAVLDQLRTVQASVPTLPP